MPKLNDTQTILLSAASQRENRSLLPLPPSLKTGMRVANAIAALVKAGLAQDLGDSSFATDAGLVAIGVEVATNPIGSFPAESRISKSATTKAATVLALLGRGQGTTLSELVEVTGWLPHTTRAALTGLRKKGHVIERFKRDDITTYRIAN